MISFRMYNFLVFNFIIGHLIPVPVLWEADQQRPAQRWHRNDDVLCLESHLGMMRRSGAWEWPGTNTSYKITLYLLIVFNWIIGGPAPLILRCYLVRYPTRCPGDIRPAINYPGPGWPACTDHMITDFWLWPPPPLPCLRCNPLWFRYLVRRCYNNTSHDGMSWVFLRRAGARERHFLP